MRDSIFKFACQNESSFAARQCLGSQKIEDKFIFDIQKVRSEYLEHFDFKETGSELPLDDALKSAQAGLAYVCRAYPIFQAECPDADKFFKKYVQGIFYYRSQSTAGGSSGSLPGIIWACPRKSWHEYDVVEFLIHESVHQFLFLDEEVNQHYTDYALSNSENLMCYSAIRKQYRPLPLVFHSLCVGIEVLRSRLVSRVLRECSGFSFHPNTDELIQSCDRALSEILSQHSQNLTPRGHELIEFLVVTLNLIQFCNGRKVSRC